MKEQYGDSNRFFMHDVGAPPPPIKSILEATTEDGSSLVSACNLGGGGGRRVHLRVGAVDTAVPPWQVRKMARVLQQCGVNVTYEEVEGKEHWWWDSKRPSDGGVVNDDAMRLVMEEMVAAKLPMPPLTWTLTVADPATTWSLWGWRVIRTGSSSSAARITCVHCNYTSSDPWKLVTSNAVEISLGAPVGGAGNGGGGRGGEKTRAKRAGAGLWMSHITRHTSHVTRHASHVTAAQWFSVISRGDPSDVVVTIDGGDVCR